MAKRSNLSLYSLYLSRLCRRLWKMLPSTHRSPLPVPVPSSKPDYNSQNDYNSRIRRPPGGAQKQHQILGPTLSLGTPTITYTSTSQFRKQNKVSMVRSTPPIRLNIYKRGDEKVAPASVNRLTVETPNGHVSSSHRLSEGDQSPGTMKRENWLQKSLRSATHISGRRGSQQAALNTKPPEKCSSTNHTDQLSVDSPPADPARKSPLLSSGNRLVGLFERLRPRSISDAESVKLAIQGKKKKGLFSHGGDSDDSSPSPTSWISARRVSTPVTSPSSEFNEDDEDCWPAVHVRPQKEKSVSPVRRKRSTSDTARFLIMRKTSRPNKAEIMGSINRKELVYKQLLKKFTCYDLMPPKGAVVAIDSQLSTRLALTILAENGVRAGFLWDSKQEMPVSLLTVTDFLRIIQCQFISINGKSPTSGKSHLTPKDLSDVLDQPILSNLIRAREVHSPRSVKRARLISVGGDDELLSALMVLRLNHLHRLPVLEPDTGNPVYLLSLKRILQFLHIHMNSLPRSKIMYESLDTLQLGTWMETDQDDFLLPTISTISPEDSMMDAVEKFLRSGASSLPVLQSDHGNTKGDGNSGFKGIRLIDALTKVDLMHFVLETGWNNLHEKKVEDALKKRNNCMERLITCHKKTPLALAIDRLILANAHRMYVVDSDHVLRAVFTVGDVLSFFIESSENDIDQSQ